MGHRPIVALLARSIRQASLPPSLIFAGPEGVGKRRVALAVAQALNCPASIGGADLDACGTCPSCTRIARGVHPDVLFLEPGDNGSIKIDQVRDAIDRAGYRPFEGRRRVLVIDDADTLVQQAQNALLKVLEEPPPSSVFLLVTSRPDSLLDTVRSRCPRLRFGQLDAADVARVLVTLDWREADAHAAAAVSDGSVARAVAAEVGDLVETRDLAAGVLAQAAASDDPRRRLEAAKALLGKGGSTSRDQLATGLRVMAALVRDVALLGASGNRAALANGDAVPLIERLSAYQGERGVRAFRAIDRALAALDRNAGVKIVADWLAMQL